MQLVKYPSHYKGRKTPQKAGRCESFGRRGTERLGRCTIPLGQETLIRHNGTPFARTVVGTLGAKGILNGGTERISSSRNRGEVCWSWGRLAGRVLRGGLSPYLGEPPVFVSPTGNREAGPDSSEASASEHLSGRGIVCPSDPPPRSFSWMRLRRRAGHRVYRFATAESSKCCETVHWNHHTTPPLPLPADVPRVWVSGGIRRRYLTSIAYDRPIAEVLDFPPAARQNKASRPPHAAPSRSLPAHFTLPCPSR